VPMPDSRPRSGTPDNWPTSSAASIRRPEVVRNMAVTGDGNVALANSLVNEVGLVEIK
jgi:hypothetical protein